jgi:hypothetical protein
VLPSVRVRVVNRRRRHPDAPAVKTDIPNTKGGPGEFGRAALRRAELMVRQGESEFLAVHGIFHFGNSLPRHIHVIPPIRVMTYVCRLLPGRRHDRRRPPSRNRRRYNHLIKRKKGLDQRRRETWLDFGVVSRPDRAEEYGAAYRGKAGVLRIRLQRRWSGPRARLSRLQFQAHGVKSPRYRRMLPDGLRVGTRC